MKYPELNEQIEKFGAYYIVSGKLEKSKLINHKDSYNHNQYDLHHYIKEQQYYRYPERYEGLQKLIILPKPMHADLHSAMSDKRFYEKYNIDRCYLLFQKRKVD